VWKGEGGGGGKQFCEQCLRRGAVEGWSERLNGWGLAKSQRKPWFLRDVTHQPMPHRAERGGSPLHFAAEIQNGEWRVEERGSQKIARIGTIFTCF